MNSVEIHFLNVGHGDCTLIRHASGRVTMIDVNNSKSLPHDDEVALAESQGLALSLFKAARAGQRSFEEYYRSLLVEPYEYFSDTFKGETIFRYLQTHPDMDHMSGLCRFFWQEQVPLLNFWDTAHAKSFDELEFDKSRYDWNDWLMYQRLRLGKTRDGDVAVHNKLIGQTGDFWTPDGLSVWSPTTDLLEYCDKQESWNNSSYVISLEFGGRRVVFGGDAEKPAWDSIEAACDEPALKCDVLKAAHHGRRSGYSETAIEKMSPSIVICSVGKKPETDAAAEYRSHGASVLSTRYHGTVRMVIWEDGEVWVYDRASTRIAALPPL